MDNHCGSETGAAFWQSKKLLALAMPFLFLLCLLPNQSAAEIYKWIDEQGRVHFGDAPRPEDNAEEIVVKVSSYKHVVVENIEFYQRDKSNRAAGTVEMFVTSWCGYCKKARQYFRSNNISYVEYDIEKDQIAHKRFQSLGGKGVPLILVGDKKMSGFSTTRFEQLYP